jgi:hypothetical protein
MPAVMAAMSASPPMTPPTIEPTGVWTGVGVIDVRVDVVADVVWVVLVDELAVATNDVIDVYFDVIDDMSVELADKIGVVMLSIGSVNTRPSCPE